MDTNVFKKNSKIVTCFIAVEILCVVFTRGIARIKKHKGWLDEI